MPTQFEQDVTSSRGSQDSPNLACRPMALCAHENVAGQPDYSDVVSTLSTKACPTYSRNREPLFPRKNNRDQ